MTAAPRVVLVVSHTHWDREWYKTAEAFRPWLVDLIDTLLDEGGPSPFLLDGQAILLEDYLSSRPERAAELSSALQRGTVEAGPWYVLPDLLIPSGEALVRNLLLGRQVLRALRAEAPPVLYCPDAFGHSAAGPGLAAGFGLQVAVAWRGYGGRGWPSGDAARWRAASGETVLLHHLPREGYGDGAGLPADDQQAAERWRTLKSALSARATLGALVVWNGADHHAPTPDSDRALAALERTAPPLPVRRAGLHVLATNLLGASATMPLPSVTGELRSSPSYVWSLPGTLSARASQKRQNAWVERLLLRDVEPWVALAGFHTPWRGESEVRAHWRSLLANHPHDTLCGCSIDAVAQAMDARLGAVMHGAEETRVRAIGHLVGHNGARDRASAVAPRSVVIVRNRSARTRGGLAELTIDLPLCAVPVGPGSAESPPVPRDAPLFQVEGMGSLQILSRQRLHVRDESPHHFPRDLLAERVVALGVADPLPGFGLRACAIRESRGPRSRGAGPRVRARAGVLSNGTIELACADGGLCLTLATGERLQAILGFETEGECGDLYTHAAIPGTHSVGQLRGHRVTMRGPLRGALTMRWRVPVAERETVDATLHAVRHRATHVDMDVVAELDAGAEFVRLRIAGENSAADYRLRAVLRTGIATATHFADAAFGVAQRSSLPAEFVSGDVERVPATHPLQRYISVFDDSRGATVLSDGLAEYEARPDGDVCVTLLRAVGELSRAGLAERPGHAGWPSPTPRGQCMGPFAATIAFLLHGPRTTDLIDRIEQVADDVLSPLTGETWRSTSIVGAAAAAGPTLTGAGLRAEACKPTGDGAWMVLRCTNLLDRPVEGEWHVGGARAACLARLDETPLGALPVRDGRVRFTAQPYAAVTILVRGERPAVPA
jgi:hypothetical protein